MGGDDPRFRTQLTHDMCKRDERYDDRKPFSLTFMQIMNL